jgi:exopolyphosphatase / guanosine-5'-triphosphate,3'-diphosphate pyrophosphatase
MKVAIIDLGTNSVRFDVHSLGPKGNAKLLHREKLMIRLGQGVFLKGLMDLSAIDRAVVAFEHFRRVADAFRVRKIVAFGTSALRESQNASVLLDRVSESAQIEIKVISGKEEAKLIALGILANERVPRHRFALVDVGGGSTEISVCQGKKVLQADSFPLGTARLQQVFLKRSPPRDLSVQQLRDYVRNIFGQRAQRWPKANTVLGSSGTAKAIAKILDKKIFTLKELRELVEEMSTMNTSQLLDIRGMEPKRVDMILAGAILLEEAMKVLGATKLIPSDFSLRDGIVEEEKELARSHKSSLIELHLDDLFGRAARFGLDEEHLRQMVDLASGLFDRLRAVHRLPPKWKVYLLSTVILRNCGEIVGFSGKERHAYYVVKNSHFPAMQGWETEFIALLCLYHSGGKVKSLASLGGDKSRELAFRRLLALVRVIDGLDLGSRTTVSLKRVTVTARAVKLVVSGRGTAGIEQLMIERKKKLFEEVFRRQLLLERVKKA